MNVVQPNQFFLVHILALKEALWLMTIVTKGVLPSFSVTIPTLSALAHAQLPDHAPKITIPRHFHNPDTNTYNSVPSLPYSSSPTGACGNQEKLLLSVPGDFHSDVTNMERMQWRLASGFFSYFLCGWGDGG